MLQVRPNIHCAAMSVQAQLGQPPALSTLPWPCLDCLLLRAAPPALSALPWPCPDCLLLRAAPPGCLGPDHPAISALPWPCLDCLLLRAASPALSPLPWSCPGCLPSLSAPPCISGCRMFQFLSRRQQAYQPLLAQSESDHSHYRPARALTRAEREQALLEQRDE